MKKLEYKHTAATQVKFKLVTRLGARQMLMTPLPLIEYQYECNKYFTHKMTLVSICCGNTTPPREKIAMYYQL